MVPALRHALTKYPHSTYFFTLSPHSLIMNPKISLTSHVMDKKRLESLMLRDKPVVPPDSVIRTFTHLKGDKVDLVLTQDGEGLCQGSFIIRRGEWAKFFLDTWFDPLYRSYNFQKAEAHALVRTPFSSLLILTHPTNPLLTPPLSSSPLTPPSAHHQEHVVQWHPTILTKLALVPQYLLNSYGVDIQSRGGKDVMYKEGEFVVRLVGCELDQARYCEKEFDMYYQQWKSYINKGTI